MSTLLAARIEAIWQATVSAYGWQLIDNPDSIVAQASDYFAHSPTVSDEHIRRAIVGYYSKRLHHGLLQREERAAIELMQLCRQNVRRWGLTESQEEDVAYDTIKKVIGRIEHIEKPETLIVFTLLALRRIAQRVATNKREIVEADLPPGMLEHYQAEALVADTVEDKLLNERMLGLFQEKLPNRLQLLVIIRVIMLGHKTGAIACDLGIPPVNVILARTRALKRLREDARVMEFYHSLRDN